MGFNNTKINDMTKEELFESGAATELLLEMTCGGMVTESWNDVV